MERKAPSHRLFVLHSSGMGKIILQEIEILQMKIEILQAGDLN